VDLMFFISQSEIFQIIFLGERDSGRRELFRTYSDLIPFPTLGPDPGSHKKVDSILVDGKEVVYELVDIPAPNERDKEKTNLSSLYGGASIILLCISIASPSTRHAVSSYLKEVNAHAPGVPIIIVGCGSERRKIEMVRTNSYFFVRTDRNILGSLFHQKWRRLCSSSF
jgi:hypothetical protein